VPKETKCDCPQDQLLGIQYGIGHPHHYDGVSEWRCRGCGVRIGRWTGNILIAGQWEPRFGIEKEQ